MASIATPNSRPPRLELAQRLSSHSKAPEQALQAIFTGSMTALRALATSPITPEIEKKARSLLSENRLEVLKETLAQAVSDYILASLTESQINAALEEHKRTGCVQDPTCSQAIQKAYLAQQVSVIQAVTQKALSFKDQWVPELVNILNNEGIHMT